MRHLENQTHMKHLTLLRPPGQKPLSLKHLKGFHRTDEYPQSINIQEGNHVKQLQEMFMTTSEFVSNYLLSGGHPYTDILLLNPLFCRRSNILRMQNNSHDSVVSDSETRESRDDADPLLSTGIDHELLNALKQLSHRHHTVVHFGSMYIPTASLHRSIMEDVKSALEASVHRSIQFSVHLAHVYFTMMPRFVQKWLTPIVPAYIISPPIPSKSSSGSTKWRWSRVLRGWSHRDLGWPWPPLFTQVEQPEMDTKMALNCTEVILDVLRTNGGWTVTHVGEQLVSDGVVGFHVQATVHDKTPYYYPGHEFI